MRRTLPLVLVVLVALAGCSGSGVSGTDGPTSATFTPAAVPTDDPLEYPPPGLSGDGIENPFALAQAHTATLDDTNFTRRDRDVLTAANGTRLVNSTTVTHVAANHSRTRSVTTGTGDLTRRFDRPVTRVEGWYDGQRYRYRGTGPNGTASVSTLRLGTPGQRPELTLQPFYLGFESVRVTTVGEDLELRVEGYEGNLTVDETRVDATETTLTVRMTNDGRIEHYRIEFSGRLVEDAETRVEGSVTATFSGFGSTTVERPDWVAAARAATENGS